MRVHTTAVPATKYLPERIHVKLTDDFDVPNNLKDCTYNLDEAETNDPHMLFAIVFLDHLKMIGRVEKIGPTLINRGYRYQIVEE